MNNPLYIVASFLFFVAACKTTKPDAKHPDKNGTLILSMERTPCYGRCPIYTIELYENGLLLYNTRHFNDTAACRYRVLTKQQIDEVKVKFNSSEFFKMANKYPEDRQTPTDLPSCILFYNDGIQKKTITDKRWETPEKLTALEQTVDSLVKSEILHFCDN